MVSSPPCFDVDSEVSMVEGMLTLLITLLSTRLQLGNTTAFYSYFFHILKSTNQFRFFMQSSLCCIQSEFQVMGSLACLVNTPVQSRSFAACSHVTSLILYMEFFGLKWRCLLQNVPSSYEQWDVALFASSSHNNINRMEKILQHMTLRIDVSPKRCNILLSWFFSRSYWKRNLTTRDGSSALYGRQNTQSATRSHILFALNFCDVTITQSGLFRL